jgi:urease gamma subunit
LELTNVPVVVASKVAPVRKSPGWKLTNKEACAAAVVSAIHKHSQQDE